MILGRLSDSLRRHDWFTVLVEIVIVVVGVFLGIQASNWNAANTERAIERQLLSQIQSDVVAAAALKTKWLVDIESHRTSLIEAIDVIQNKPEQQTISDAQCRAMWTSHLIFYPVAPLGSLDEILSRGDLSTSRGQALRPSLLRYRDHYEVIKQLNTSLIGLANLADTYGYAFPRHIVANLASSGRVDEAEGDVVARVTDSTFQTTCVPEVIRADQTMQNKLLSNLARTDGVLQRVRIELSALQHIETDLMESGENE